MSEDIEKLALPGGEEIAYRQRLGKSSTSAGRMTPGVLFCGGFHSDMDGTKATFLDKWAAREGRNYVRFDYRGHGSSTGRFDEGTIGDWFADALLVLDKVCQGPQIIVGSSMGAWMALLLTRERQERVAGLVLIAPAPDFPRQLMWPSLPEEAKHAIENDGTWARPSEFEDDAYPITKRLIDESAAHEILSGSPIPFDGPVRILHGLQDEVVPLTHAQRCLDVVTSDNVVLSVSKNGDHRLSSPDDLDRLIGAIEELL